MTQLRFEPGGLEPIEQLTHCSFYVTVVVLSCFDFPKEL